MKTTIKKAKVSFDFRSQDAARVATMGDATVTGFTGNTNFTALVVPLVTITTQVTAVRNTLRTIAAGNTSKALTAQLAQQSNTLMFSLVANGHYVEDTANILAAGDEKKAEQLILATGYKLKKKTTPHPRDFEVVETGVGWVHLRAKKAEAKKQEAHIWRYGLTLKKGTPPETVITRITLEADIIITDLASSTVVGVQHASITSATRTGATSVASTQTSKAATSIPVSKSRHPLISHASSEPYQWTDFIYAVIP